MSGPDPAVLGALMELIGEALAGEEARPVVIGICGAQGSGKTTLARAAASACDDRGIANAVISIDDLYLTRAERQALARDVHPLLATRGPPGTHDIALGMAVFDALARGGSTRLPRFDKARDDRTPCSDWPQSPARCEVLLFEGWCVGACPQSDAQLGAPVNALEAEEDRQVVWRKFVNNALGASYKALFDRIDRLVMLAVPSFDVVFEWRMQQERELREKAGPESSGVMGEAAIARFIQHYERLTRHTLAEMPARAGLLVRLDEQRHPVEITTSR